MPPDPEYVAARRVLLDALGALDNHRNAVVLVGAQAIYLRVGEGDLSTAPYTTDADLAIDPRQLDDKPDLAQTLEAAGFELAISPGTWTLHPTEVQIDFLVPSSLGGPGRRGARLGPHGTHIARKATGLEAAMVDHSLIRVGALDPGDNRVFDVSVAGITAMLVAKLHKIDERKNDPNRLQPKDALDVLRLLRFADTSYLPATLKRLAKNPVAGKVTLAARTFLFELFGERDALGSQMAAQSSAGLEDEVAIAISCEVLAQRLLKGWK